MIVYGADTDCLKDSLLFEQGMSLLPKERQCHVQKMRYQKGKCERLGVALLLYHAIKEKGYKNPDLSFFYNKQKKPFLKQYPHLFFNLSHSNEKVLCAVCEKEIGCDVEIIQEARVNLAKRFFHPYEVSMLEACKEDEKDACFTNIWSAKESFVKANGSGLSIDLSSFFVRFLKDEIIYEGKSEFCYKGKLIPLWNQFVCSVCIKDDGSVQNTGEALSYQIISLEQVIRSAWNERPL